MTTHKHHIIPKHMGGSNDPSNLIELTVEEHANAHKLLFETHGKWQDYLAWKALSGQINTDEIRRELTRLTWLGKKHTEESKQKIRDKRANQICTEQTRQKMSATRKGRKITWNLNNASPEANKKRKEKMTGIPKQKLTCPHCNKVGGAPTMKQWHFDKCKEIKCT